MGEEVCFEIKYLKKSEKEKPTNINTVTVRMDGWRLHLKPDGQLTIFRVTKKKFRLTVKLLELFLSTLGPLC